MEVQVRQERINEIREIYEINRLAFGQESEARLVNLLRKSEAFIPELSMVAKTSNKLVGYILFSKIHVIDDLSNRHESLALAPVAVIPEFQGNGIGKQLIVKGLSKAGELNYKSVIVLGHKHYYPRFGFVEADKWNIRAPFEISSNGAFMALELIPEGLNGISGIVKYPKEFEMVG